MSNKIKIKLDENAIKPNKAHDLDGGFDLYAPQGAYIECNGSVVIDTGVHIQLPPNTVGLLVSKSGLYTKRDLTSTGLIDSGYTGSIRVKLQNHKSSAYMINKGDKISQLVILPIVPIGNDDLVVVDELDESDRGDNGFGSTGR